MSTMTRDDILSARRQSEAYYAVRRYDRRRMWRYNKAGEKVGLRFIQVSDDAVSNRELYESTLTAEGDVEDTALAAGITTTWDVQRQVYPEPDVTTVSDKHADMFWRNPNPHKKNACVGIFGPWCANCFAALRRDTRTYKPEQRRSDTFESLQGLKLYPSFDKFGNRIIRHFDTPDTNYTVRIAVRHDERGEYFAAELYRNVKMRSGKWVGRKLADYRTPNPYNDASEQRVTYWMMGWFARIAG